MIDVNDRTKCTGCTACVSICPKKCISMIEDEEGFKYPFVNIEECIHCHRCEKVCPINVVSSDSNQKIEAYTVRAKMEEYLMNGTSGGFIGPIFEYVLNKGGTCCAASFDDNMSVRHFFVNSKEEWKKYRNVIQGSKYVQSDLEGCFDKIKELLKQNKDVLFIGTPCQVNGLRNFLEGVDINKLVLIDLVCHGVPSHLLWDKYKLYQEKKYNSKIVGAQFRKKTYGYKGSTMSLTFSNGKKYDGFLRTDLMLKAYYGNVGTRYSCFSCPAKGDRRSSDFTVFDSWHASILATSIKDDNMGYTNILVNNSKALSVWDKIKDNYIYYKVNAEDAIKYDGIMYENCSIENSNRNRFYILLKDSNLLNVMSEVMPVTFTDRLRVLVKKVLLLGKRIQ